MQVFNCIPTDAVSTFSQLAQYRSVINLASVDPQMAKSILHKVQGNLVLFPLFFLSQENLTLSPLGKAGLAPSTVWT
jgi:phospholipase D1/2